MNAENKTDPFEQMLARRVKVVRVEGWPEFELREAPLAEVEPLIFSNGSMAPQELLFQLIGKSIWIGEHRGSPDIIKRMGPTAIAKLIAAVQADIFDLYGIPVEKEDEANPDEANPDEAAPPKPARKSKKKG